MHNCLTQESGSASGGAAFLYNLSAKRRSQDRKEVFCPHDGHGHGPQPGRLRRRDDAQEETAGGETSGTEESSGAAFKVGVIGPTTGGAAIYGTAVANAAQIAVDEINALGGDIQFELMVEDDTNDAETAVNAYNTLMGNGMQILLGTVHHQPPPWPWCPTPTTSACSP